MSKKSDSGESRKKNDGEVKIDRKTARREGEVLRIGEVRVEPGEHALVDLSVGRLPSGTLIRIRAHVVRSVNPGPVVLLLGGVHGDEINGIEIVRRAVFDGMLDGLLCGTIIGIPLLNVFGFLNYSRAVPDGKDVNRSFPGSATGSLASRVAFTLSHQILPLIDFGLDFHTGGRSHYNHPQLRFSPSDTRARGLAAAFAPPIVLESRPIQKTLRSAANKLGKPILTYEGGENARLNLNTIEMGLAGTLRVLVSEGMLPGPAAPPLEPITNFDHHSWLRSKRAGLFEWRVASGESVTKGEVLGYVRDPYGRHEEPIVAPRKAYIIGHDNSPVISQGDALFHLAWTDADAKAKPKDPTLAT